MKERMIDLPIGTKVRYRGKHGVVVAGDYDCHDCILKNNGTCAGRFACVDVDRRDETDVYVKEIVR